MKKRTLLIALVAAGTGIAALAGAVGTIAYLDPRDDIAEVAARITPEMKTYVETHRTPLPPEIQAQFPDCRRCETVLVPDEKIEPSQLERSLHVFAEKVAAVYTAEGHQVGVNPYRTTEGRYSILVQKF